TRGATRRDEHDRIAGPDDDGSGGLLGESAGFEFQSRLADRNFTGSHTSKSRVQSKGKSEVQRFNAKINVKSSDAGVTQQGSADRNVAVPRVAAGPLLSDVEALDQIRVARRVFHFEVIEQPATSADEHQQATTRMMIFGVRLEVFGEV